MTDGLKGSDSMESLFAPWRMAYIKNAKKEPGCIFCLFPAEKDDKKRLILARGEKVFVIMNAFPYNPGHLMVAPYRHVGNYEELDDEELLEMHKMASECIKVLKKTMSPQGFNLGVNIGEVAGAGFAGHVHLHVVPRWAGDTNFMPVTAQVRVLPEALEETWAKLKEAWDEGNGS
ncbi:histidine triad (HIT) protein [Thermovirga lienii DSM 17291]|uniref:Histidine triad (HIT) protein n=2 Tax=Thermovirga TaxID=336260 RepID=G7V9C2_THELD|nr:histidine triad (HIT) protein [Thermovirga lienii DSM 17291]